MMGTTKRRKKISSAGALREEEGVGQRDPGSGRSQPWQAVAWEAPAVVRPVAPAAYHRVRRGADSAPAAAPGTPDVFHRDRARLRPVVELRQEQALVGQPLAPDLRRVPPAGVRGRKRQKARRDRPGGENPGDARLRRPARQVAPAPGAGRKPARPALGKAEPGRQPGNRLPAVEVAPAPGKPPSRVEAAEAARRRGQGVAPTGSRFLTRAQFSKRGYSLVAALFLSSSTAGAATLFL
jgi:hypothetical protein